MGKRNHTIGILTVTTLAAFLLAASALSAFAGGVAILNTVITDNGDDDGYADTQETVSVRLTVQNTSGVPLTDVTLRLVHEEPGPSCLITPSVSVGDLAPGEVKLTDPFAFHVGDRDRTTLGLGKHDPLWTAFAVEVDSQPADQPAHPSRIVLDLDLNVAGGAGPSLFLEQFEDLTLGTFEVDNMDDGKHSLGASDGYRCQYNDPDRPGSNTHGTTFADVCILGNSPDQARAVFWGLSGPSFSPLGGRGFSGFHSLFFGIDPGPPANWTTSLTILEAAKTSDPIHLDWDGASPYLSIMHQVSLVDARFAGVPEGSTYDRAVVMAQLADENGQPAAPWFRLEPYQNVYTNVSDENTFNCAFDPIDDGNTEDDFFPGDPEYGPSSTCYPALTYTSVGETSNPFAPANVGFVDGPGLVGNWGIGTWIESRFDLSRFRGRSLRIRFLFAGIQGGNSTIDTWAALYPQLENDGRDDGWWIDDVGVTDTLSTPADLSTDDADNGGLPGPPGGDTDGDGRADLCDICPLDHDPGQEDGDGDGAGAACDCDDSDDTVYPGAPEINDGIDNNCPGDPGWDLIDELEGPILFQSPQELIWTPQPGASLHRVARAESLDFVTGCATFPAASGSLIDATDPTTPGDLLYYLVQPWLLNTGSWGANSAQEERTVPCAF